MFILYPAVLLDLLINSNSFLWNLLFFIYKMTSSANRANFTSPFQIWIAFISFSCPVPLVRTSSPMLNWSGESGDPVPYLREKSFSFSPLSMILAMGFSYLAFILRYFSSLSSLLEKMQLCNVSRKKRKHVSVRDTISTITSLYI